MDEAEWLKSDDPFRMLDFLGARMSDRKLRLFSVACCRRIERLDEYHRGAVEVAERYADGLASPAERRAAWDSVAHLSSYTHEGVLEVQRWVCALLFALGADNEWPVDPFSGQFVHHASGVHTPTDWARSAAYFAARSTVGQGYERMKTTASFWGRLVFRVKQALSDGYVGRLLDHDFRAECREQPPLLRDIAGNPFRPIALEPNWLRQDDNTVLKMASILYQERRCADLPILADALEDAGCDNADILSHLRGPGPHVRGCWVVDLLLGKE